MGDWITRDLFQQANADHPMQEDREPDRRWIGGSLDGGGHEPAGSRSGSC